MNVPQWEYRANPETLHSDELGDYPTYALEAWQRQGEGWVLADTVHDFSADQSYAVEAAQLFTRHQLEPIHLRDAAEDFLQT